MKMKKYHIYIPIEIFVREINPKILFTFNAINRNYRVYLGTKTGIDKITQKKIKDKKKSGFFFYKSQVSKKNRQYTDKIKNAFEKLIILDEELGVGVSNLKDTLKHRAINPNDIDKFFIIGKIMMKNLTRYIPTFKKKAVISGWLKYDIYHKKNLNLFSSELNEIKKKYKDFYLFSSNYGALSNKGLNARIESNSDIKKYRHKDYLTFKHSIKDFSFLKKKYFLFFKENPKINFIIRPHPSDQLYSDWKVFEKFKNVKVINKYDIVPWIMASKGLIHRGCTTAIDAFFLKKSIYYFLPNRKIHKKEKNLTYKISNKINNLDLIKIKSYKKMKNQNSLIQREIYYKQSAAERILKELQKIKTTKENKISFNHSENFINYLLPFLGNIKLVLKKYILRHSITKNAKVSKFIDTKTLIEKLNSINSRNIKINVKKITREVFEIEKV